MAKEKRASWFKMFSHQLPLMEAVPDDVLGRAMKGVMHYFVTGEKPQLDMLENAVFCALSPYVDEAFEDYDKMVQQGKKARSGKKADEEIPMPF